MRDIFQINIDFQINLLKIFYSTQVTLQSSFISKKIPMFIAVAFTNIHFLPRLILSVSNHGDKMGENAKREKP